MFLFCLLSLKCTLDFAWGRSFHFCISVHFVFLYILKAVVWILAQISCRAEHCICTELRKWFTSKSPLKIRIIFSGTIFNFCCWSWVTKAYCCSDSKQNVTLNQMKIFSFLLSWSTMKFCGKTFFFPFVVSWKIILVHTWRTGLYTLLREKYHQRVPQEKIKWEGAPGDLQLTSALK